MAKALLVDTNYSAAPIYNYLTRLGLEVYVIGGNHEHFLAKSAKNYIDHDYSNIEKAIDYITELGIDFLVPGCNDHSMQVCAQINSEISFYGIDSESVIESINNKEKFRSLATELKLPVPNVLGVNVSHESLPVIVKPVDAYSGHGMTVVRDLAGLKAAISLASGFSGSGQCLVEHYVEGQLFSHSAFIQNGEIALAFVVEEHGTANPFVVDTSRVVYDFDEAMLQSINMDIGKIINKLGLNSGLIHTQFVVRGDSYWLIEVTRRCPGDQYSMLIELSTGFPYAEAYATPFVNENFKFEDVVLRESWVMRHTITQAKQGVLGSLNFKCPVNIDKLIPLSVAGDLIKESPFSRIALMFARSESAQGLDLLFKRTLERELYSICEDQ